jgi:hypothetical protein
LTGLRGRPIWSARARSVIESRPARCRLLVAEVKGRFDVVAGGFEAPRVDLGEHLLLGEVLRPIVSDTLALASLRMIWPPVAVSVAAVAVGSSDSSSSDPLAESIPPRG